MILMRESRMLLVCPVSPACLPTCLPGCLPIKLQAEQVVQRKSRVMQQLADEVRSDGGAVGVHGVGCLQV